MADPTPLGRPRQGVTVHQQQALASVQKEGRATFASAALAGATKVDATELLRRQVGPDPYFSGSNAQFLLIAL